MFLVHRPTGLAVGLGKRMGWGWYRGNEGEDLGALVSRLYDVLEREHSYEWKQDDFAIALEDASGASLALKDWRYGEKREDGLVQLMGTQHIEPEE